MTSNSIVRHQLIAAAALLAASSLAASSLLGCGSTSASSSAHSATVTIAPSTPPSLDAGQSISLAATVTGDSTNAGALWQLEGPGILSAATSTSVTYTAPASLTTARTSAVEAIPVANNLASAILQINLNPVLFITTSTAPNALINTTYTLQLASTGGTGTATWTLASGALPTGITLSTRGLLSGTPTQYGSFSFVVSATDAATTPAVTTQSLTIVVTPAALNITTATLPNTVSGNAYSATLASSGGIAPDTWSIVSGTLPTGLALSSAGVLSGTANTPGTYTFTVQVTDSESVPVTAQKQFTVIVYTRLAISTTTLPNGEQNSAYAQTLAATGGTSPLDWTITSGALPTGITLSTTGTLSGTPSVSGTFQFTAQVTDASVPQQVAAQAYTLTLAAPLAITTTALPNATLNIAYSTTLATTGGNAPITFTLVSGTLPTGLSLSTAGVISGTPIQSGVQTITVQATDATSATSRQSLTITVSALAPLTITTTSVPSGNIGVAYSQTLAATGGAVPYTWTLSTGALPPGLALSTSGMLSGTPTTLGTYNFTVQVADSEPTPTHTTQSYTLSIANAGANAALTGHYAFLLSGFLAGNTASTVYGFAEIGSLTFDGAGNVTGIADLNTPSGAQQSLAVTGTYSLGTDNRGLLAITVGSASSTYTLAASQPSSGIMQSIALAESDDSTGTSAQSSGFARLQTTSAFAATTLKNTFAFGLSGESCATCASTGFGPIAAAGIITGDGVSALSAGAEDLSAYGQNFSGITLAGSFAAPTSTNGRGTLTLNPTGTTITAQPADFTYVIVSANEFLLLSTDTHAANALLFGDAQLQQQSTYAAATEFSGRSIGYESQPSGGNGSSVYPTALNATLYQLTNTGSGTASFFKDSNAAGTFTTSPSATAVTFTTSSTGRVLIATGGASNQILYLYNTGAGFGLDLATSTGYPAALRYELQVKLSASLPAIPSGSLAAGTLATPVRATDTSGTYVFAPSQGGVNVTQINGSLTTALDSSTAAGVLASDQTSTFTTAEDYTGRQTATLASTVAAVTYIITTTHAVSIPTTGTTPTVTTLQQ